MIIFNYRDPYSILSFLDDQEQQETLLEDIEENGFVADGYPGQVDSVYFSVDGDSLYTVMGKRIQRINLLTGGILSKRISRKVCSTLGWRFRLVPVKRGVLCEANSCSLELWNSELSVCKQRWTGFFVQDFVPLQEERVALGTVSGDDFRQKVIIVDTTSEKIVSTIANFYGKFLACNNKCEVLTTTDGKSLQLWRKNRVLWEIRFQLNSLWLYSAVTFSPTEEYVVIPCEFGSYILDAVSGKVIFQWEDKDVNNMKCIADEGLILGYGDNIKFISNEDCIVGWNDSTGFCLRLYNVISGDLLSEIVEEQEFQRFAVCPRKRLVAILLRNSEDHFEIIQVKLPGDKEKTSMKRSVETKFISRQNKNDVDNNIMLIVLIVVITMILIIM